MSVVRTVLVADDSATMAKQLTRVIEETGRYKVVAQVTDGLEALKQVKAQNPDIICLDVVMPNLNGVQALRMIKQLKTDARVVMITSVGGIAEKVAECLKAGALNVLSKPFDAKKVIEVLDSI